MIRILEIAWLVLTITTAVVATVQFFEDGIQSALWMFLVSGAAFTMYLIRRKQRIRIYDQQRQQQDETTRYH